MPCRYATESFRHGPRHSRVKTCAAIGIDGPSIVEGGRDAEDTWRNITRLNLEIVATDHAVCLEQTLRPGDVGLHLRITMIAIDIDDVEAAIAQGAKGIVARIWSGSTMCSIPDARTLCWNTDRIEGSPSELHMSTLTIRPRPP